MITLQDERTRVTLDQRAVIAMKVRWPPAKGATPKESGIAEYNVTLYTHAVRITIAFNDLKEVERFERVIREQRGLNAEFRVQSLSFR